MAPRRASGSETTISAVSVSVTHEVKRDTDYYLGTIEPNYSFGSNVDNKSPHEVKRDTDFFLGTDETDYFFGTNVDDKSLHEIKRETDYFLGTNVDDESPH